MDTMTKMPEIVDDGYHPKDEQTQDGIDSPVWHLVGDSSSIQQLGGQIVDRLSGLDRADAAPGASRAPRTARGPSSTSPATPCRSWARTASTPTCGSQTARACCRRYAINQQLSIPSFYVEVFAVNLGLIQ